MELFCAKIGEATGHRAAYALLEYAFFRSYGREMPEIEKSAEGKPFFPSAPDIHFSLSHTKEYVLCALGGSPVGADIETVREIRPALERRVRAEEERACFSFFQSWVLKESYIKLFGRTELRLRDIRFTGSPEGIIPPTAGVRARLYAPVPGCFAAACSETEELPEKISFVQLSISSPPATGRA